MSISKQKEAEQAALAKKGLRECPRCREIKPLSSFRYHSLTKTGVCSCVQCTRKASLAWNDKLKAEVVAKYGGCCRRCGEQDIDVLTVDHIAQDGAAHKREHGLTSGSKTWLWLKRNGYPKGFRVLCFNCNIKAYRKFLRKQRA